MPYLHNHTTAYMSTPIFSLHIWSFVFIFESIILMLFLSEVALKKLMTNVHGWMAEKAVWQGVVSPILMKAIYQVS